MTLKRNIILLFMIAMCLSIFSETPYKYYLTVNVWKKIESEMTIKFFLNTPSMNIWNMEYGDDDEKFLETFIKINNNGTYNNEIIIEGKGVAGDTVIDVKHASIDFLELDAISQLRHLFTEIKFEVDSFQYLLDLENLDSSALRLNYHEIFQAYSVINFDITKEFLSKYCILQEKNVPEKSD